MQQNDLSKLDVLIRSIQHDVRELNAGDPAARTRLVEKSAQLQRVVESPAERTFKMRFAASIS